MNAPISMKRHLIKQSLAAVLKCGLTLAIILAGVHASRLLWTHYRTAPWTRDGRVIAESVRIVPEVSGRISRLEVSDNQRVEKGDLLFTVDPESYELALRSAEAELATRREELELRKEIAARRRKLAGDRAISIEESQAADSAVQVAESAVTAAGAARDTARLDLSRTSVISPVNGYVTNLHLRQGGYASAGQPQFSIIDADSFWIAGYFEETKLSSIHPGDRARIDLMQGGTLQGEVESLSRGIADATAETKGPADVDPVFNWVRLAQRIPVRIRLSHIPDGLLLASGMTCNIHLSPGAASPAPGPHSGGELAGQATVLE